MKNKKNSDEDRPQGGSSIHGDLRIDELAAKTAAFSGADIASVCNVAAPRAVRRAIAAEAAVPAGPGSPAQLAARQLAGQWPLPFGRGGLGCRVCPAPFLRP